MKRTFLFGVLGALLCLPWDMGLASLLLLMGLPSSHSEFILRTGSWIYQILDQVSLQANWNMLARIFPILWVGLLIIIAWKLRFIKKDYLGFWRIPNKYADSHPGGWLGMAGRISIILLFVAGGGYLFIKSLNGIVFKYLLLSTSFGPFAGPLYYVLYLVPPFFVLGFVEFSFTYSVMTSVTAQEVKEKIKAPLAGVMVLVAMTLLSIYFQNLMDINKRLNDIPGFTTKTEPRSLIVLTERPGIIHLMDNFTNTILSMELEKENTPYSEGNVRAVNSYLKSKGYFTALNSTAIEYLASYSMRELNPRSAAKVFIQGFASTGDYGPAVFGLMRILFAPADLKYHKLLTELSDESRFIVKGGAALKIARCYEKFGEQDKAKYWYAKGTATGNRPGDKKYDYKPSDKPLFYGGRINGQIVIEEIPGRGVRVGLIKKESAEAMIKKISIKDNTLNPEFGLFRLTDGTAADNEGRFMFDHLGDGEYVRLLSITNEDGKKYKIIKSPGVVAISKGKPFADAGVIKLAVI